MVTISRENVFIFYLKMYSRKMTTISLAYPSIAMDLKKNILLIFADILSINAMVGTIYILYTTYSTLS